MWIPPVIERELRVALRKHNAVKSRLYTAALGSAAVAIFFFLSWGLDAGFSGAFLHKLFFYAGLYLSIMPVLNLSVGMFCEERRNQTLELLYLTGMNSGELFIGKLLGGILVASSDLLALAPLLAIPFFSGGISFDLFLATIACFPLMLLFTVAMGALASAICKDDSAAWTCAMTFAAIICFAVPLPYYLGAAATGAPPFSNNWLFLSPAFAPYVVAIKFAGFRPQLFWQCAGVTLAITLLALVLAAIILKWNWRRSVARTADANHRGHWQTLIHGSASWRLKLRRQILPRNAFQWLAEQERRAVFTCWAFIIGIIACWFLGWAVWPTVWPSPMNFYITAFVLLVGASVFGSYAAGRRIGMDRRDGSLELLLTTPLSPEEIVDGQIEAVNRQFRPVWWTLLGLSVTMMLAGFATRTWTPSAVISYVVIWCFFFGYCLYPTKNTQASAMWVSLNTGRPQIVFRTGSKGWPNQYWWIWLVINFHNLWNGIGQASRFPTGSAMEVVFVCFFGIVGWIIAAAVQHAPSEIRTKLITNMRDIAREPVPDPSDPRLKKWDGKERLPTLNKI